jgi:hypothetical protein
MKIRLPLSFIRKVQLFITLTIAVTALLGGIGLIATNGLGMNPDILSPTPFDSFVIPGLILAGIIGGTQITAFYALFKRQANAQFLVAVAGFGIVIWLFVEVYWVLHTSPLQVIYFVLGILELAAVMGMLKIAPQIVRNDLKNK